MATGRTLSLRNQAIDAPFPQINEDDVLISTESLLSPTFAKKGFLPAIHMFRLRSIGGDILESVYIARPRNNPNTAPTPSDTQPIVDGLRQRLARWHSVLDECTLPGSMESLEMKCELCLTIILLNRPSPSFPNPTNDAIESCAAAAREAIEAWSILCQRGQLTVLWRTFHDVLITGLAWLYCVWYDMCNYSHCVRSEANFH